MPLLSADEISFHLTKHPNWKIEGDELVRTYIFETFPQAVEFVNKVAGIAEESNHHPDIDIRYNRVRLALVSHDLGGISSMDFAVAAGIDKIFQ